VRAIKEWPASLIAPSALSYPALDTLGVLPIVVNVEDAAKRSAERPPIGLQEPGFWQFR